MIGFLRTCLHKGINNIKVDLVELVLIYIYLIGRKRKGNTGVDKYFLDNG